MAPGSMADVPKDLVEQIKRLEELFTVPTEKLKEITTHFMGELEKGLQKEGSTVVGLQPSKYRKSLLTRRSR